METRGDRGRGQGPDVVHMKEKPEHPPPLTCKPTIPRGNLYHSHDMHLGSSSSITAENQVEGLKLPCDSRQGQEVGLVKEQPPEHLLQPGGASTLDVHIKEEPKERSFVYDVKVEALCVDEEELQSSGSHGVSAAAMLASLYTDHIVKDELLLGPELLHRPSVNQSGTMPADRDSGLEPHLALKDCTVRLERIPYNTLLARTERTSNMEDIDCIYNTDSEIPYPVDFKTLSNNESIEEGMHTGFDSEIPCYVCSKRFTHKADLMKHIAIHIYNPSSELDGNVIHSDTEVDNEVHACDICGKIFDLKLELMEHVVSHIYVQEECEVNDPPCVAAQEPRVALALCAWDHTYAVTGSVADGGRAVSSAAGVAEALGRRCSVRLERLLLDAERRACRVGRRTYRRRATPATDTYRCDHCDKAFRHKSVLSEHINTHLSTRLAQSHYSTREGSNLEQNKKLDTSLKGNSQRHESTDTSKKPFQCNYCDYRFSQKRDLRIHEMTHTGVKPFQCYYCDYNCTKKGKLRIHEMTHTGVKPYQCKYCGYKCGRKGDLRRHEMTHTGVKPFQCNYCDYNCTVKGNLRIHEMTHTGVKPFQCNYCDYKCTVKGNLRKHKMTHTGVKPYHCDYCDYKCSQKENLRRHVMTHTGVKPFQCNYCDYKCNQNWILRQHEMTHTGVKPYQCKYCGYKCGRKGDLRRHEMTHTGVKPFQCNYCDYKCNVKGSLRIHEMTHTGVKPYQCKYCDYKCGLKGDLRKHEMTHTGVKPYQCSYCDYKCTVKGNLRIHEMTHTGVKPFQCNYCDYKCSQKGYLRIHEMKHTGVKPFQCNYCDYKCTVKGSLRIHDMTHTGVNPDHCDYSDYKCSRSNQLRSHERTHNAKKPFKLMSCDNKTLHLETKLTANCEKLTSE